MENNNWNKKIISELLDIKDTKMLSEVSFSVSVPNSQSLWGDIEVCEGDRYTLFIRGDEKNPYVDFILWNKFQGKKLLYQFNTKSVKVTEFIEGEREYFISDITDNYYLGLKFVDKE